MARGNYRAAARRIAREFGIPPALFLSLVSAESGWNPGAVSPAGASGLTQLMPGTARGLGVEDPFNPIQNLRGGAKYLSGQYRRFKRWDLALAAYNAGPGAVEKYGGIPPYRETQAYVKKVLGGRKYQGLSPGQKSVSGIEDLGLNDDALQLAAIENLGRMAQGNFSPLASLSSITKALLKPTEESSSSSGKFDTQSPSSTVDTSAKPMAGNWGGSLPVADQYAAIAKQFGLGASGKRETKFTSSGGVSDHWVGSKNAFAYDLSGSKAQMDRAARALAKALGIGWNGQNELIQDVYKGPFRIQIIYNTPKYGGHLDHIHLGVRRVK